MILEISLLGPFEARLDEARQSVIVEDVVAYVQEMLGE
jgi:hypothetical protein